jgi:hypothetical protein
MRGKYRIEWLAPAVHDYEKLFYICWNERRWSHWAFRKNWNGN